MSTYLTRAVPLRVQSFMRDDRIVVLYTSDHGKVTALLRGGKKIKAKLVSPINLLAECEIMIAPGKRLDIVAGIKIAQRFAGVETVLRKRMLALQFFDSINILSAEQHSDPGVYELCIAWLTVLDTAEERVVSELFVLVGICRLLAKVGFEYNAADTHSNQAVHQLLRSCRSAQSEKLWLEQMLIFIQTIRDTSACIQHLVLYIQQLTEFELRGMRVYQESVIV